MDAEISMEIEAKRIVSDSQTGVKDSSLSKSMPKRVPHIWTIAILIASDITSLAIASILSMTLQLLILNKLVVSYFQIATIIILCLSAYGLYGLYSGFRPSPVEELRKLSISTSLIFLVISVQSFWFNESERLSYIFLTLIWGMSLLLLPLGRSLMRSISARLDFNGEPTVIIGYGQIGKALVRHLKNNARQNVR
jgi:FlaA1/EpsC-like NDP-sugar epimerase